MRKKREALVNSLDPNLTEEQKSEMVRNYDAKIANLAAMIQKDLRDAVLKLSVKKRREKAAAGVVEEGISREQSVIREAQKHMKQLLDEKRQLRRRGVHSQQLRKEREIEYKAHVDALALE